MDKIHCINQYLIDLHCKLPSTLTRVRKFSSKSAPNITLSAIKCYAPQAWLPGVGMREIGFVYNRTYSCSSSDVNRRKLVLMRVELNCGLQVAGCGLQDKLRVVGYRLRVRGYKIAGCRLLRLRITFTFRNHMFCFLFILGLFLLLK